MKKKATVAVRVVCDCLGDVSCVRGAWLTVVCVALGDADIDLRELEDK